MAGLQNFKIIMEKKTCFNTGLRSADGKGKRKNESVAAVLPMCTE